MKRKPLPLTPAQRLRLHRSQCTIDYNACLGLLEHAPNDLQLQTALNIATLNVRLQLLEERLAPK